VLSLAAVLALAPTAPGVLVALVAAPLAVPPLRIVASRTDPPSLVQALVATARLQLVFSSLLALGLAL
ncbi:MAG TPA: 1,4-dihydroxy-2-naphthoate polyprenyltransferase, partial [Actinomycetes bacterium]|nr:1,4-dihydroxy-2-naphthoate polyprenyltransferase [Actinomycetes bacterium]